MNFLENQRYQNYSYKDVFWGEGKRFYEDYADKYAISSSLMPTSWLVDLGGGFGRLIPAYHNKAKNIIIVDNSNEILAEAQKDYKNENNIYFIHADIYQLPFKNNSLESGLIYRVMHHIEDVPRLLQELNRIISKNLYLEFANKNNLLRFLRYCAGDRSVDILSSYCRIGGKDSFLNFSPTYIKSCLKGNTNFEIKKIIKVSLFRRQIFKRHIPPRILFWLERQTQRLVPFDITPSIFLILSKNNSGEGLKSPLVINELLACPKCNGYLDFTNKLCISCGNKFAFKERYFDFEI